MKLCRCPGPGGDTRPRRGTVCGRCDRLVVGPARSSDTAYLLEQTRRRGAPARRALRGIAGSSGVQRFSEEEAMRRARARDREERREAHAEQSAGQRGARIGFGYGALTRLYAPVLSRIKADRRRRARAQKRRARKAAAA